MRAHICDQVEAIVDEVVATVRPGDHLVIMSNGAFGGLHERLIAALELSHV
jgi:UDP-N-acetylmuramate: L-alanyl-gamma-D-glutamyl-meso-diaminopimelate ligase